MQVLLYQNFQLICYHVTLDNPLATRVTIKGTDTQLGLDGVNAGSCCLLPQFGDSLCFDLLISTNIQSPNYVYPISLFSTTYNFQAHHFRKSTRYAASHVLNSHAQLAFNTTEPLMKDQPDETATHLLIVIPPFLKPTFCIATQIPPPPRVQFCNIFLSVLQKQKGGSAALR